MGGSSPRITEKRVGYRRQVADIPYSREEIGSPISLRTEPTLTHHWQASGSSDNHNEIVFRHVYPAGQAATRELIERYCTEAHVEIRKRLGINMFYTDALGDTIIVVTRKPEKHQGDWILTGDISVRFPSPTVASQVYEQQRIQHNNTDTQSARLIGHTGHVCPTIISTSHSGETSQDDSLHKRKRTKNPLQEGPLKGIGPSVGMQPYKKGRV